MPGVTSHLVRTLLLALAIAVAGVAPATAQEAEVPGPYRLGPSEEIALRVVVWDNVALSFADLEAISGVYTVSSDGLIMLPIIGAVPAAGASAVELSERIAGDLQRHTGLAETPSVAIEIQRYRPVFVLGDVARPGEYPYRPGMRAKQLLALAGGFYRLSDEMGSGLVREGIRVAGSLRETRIDLTAARIREARLLAEAAGETDFSLPAGLSHPDGASAVEQIYVREKRLLVTRREALARGVASLESSREQLNTEVRILEDQSTGLSSQAELMSEAVGNLETLVEKGLARSPNLLTMQRALFDLESRQLDAKSKMFRAGQESGEIDRDLIDVTQKRATEVLNELQDIQAQIARLNVRAETSQRMLVETQAEAALAAEDDAEPELVPIFQISREAEGQLVNRIVRDDEKLWPLDVLEVRWTDPSDIPTE